MSDFLDDEKKIVNMLKLDAMGLVLENYAYLIKLTSWRDNHHLMFYAFSLFSGEKWCYILKEEASTSNLLRNIPTVDVRNSFVVILMIFLKVILFCCSLRSSTRTVNHMTKWST